MRPICLPAVLALVALARPAAAENHFLLELEGGFARPLGVEGGQVDSGYGYSGTFGFGGRIRGFSPAYYLVGKVGYGETGQFGPNRFGRARLLREQTELAVGGRVYLPLTDRLRVLLQVALGQTYETASVDRVGHPGLSIDEDLFTLFGQTGLQYRLNDHLSLGAGLDTAWMFGDDPDLGAKAAGFGDEDGARGRLRLGLTMTFHF